MHMHIGNGLDSNSTFPFDTIRNVAMILLVYEPLLDGLPNGILYPAALPVDPVRTLFFLIGSSRSHATDSSFA